MGNATFALSEYVKIPMNASVTFNILERDEP